MTEQEKINLNAEIKGITIPKIWFFAGSSIFVLFTIFMMYSSIINKLSLIEQQQKEYNRRIEKVETKLGM